MLAFQKSTGAICPVSSRGRFSAPQPMIHMLSSESPRSPGTSRAMPAASGHVIATVIPTNARITTSDLRAGPSSLFVASDELFKQHLDDGGGGDRKDGADNTQQLAAHA